MQESKKQLENLLINYFRDSYSVFPKGRILSTESPDFIIKSKHGEKLGIELVRLHSAFPFHSSVDPENSELNIKLIDTVKELVERTNHLSLFVKFQFSEKNPIAEERLLSVSALVSNLIRKRLSNRNEHSFFVRHFSSKELPEGIDGILLVHHPGLSESLWEAASLSGEGGNLLSDLQHAIEKKEEKIYIYRKRKLDEYWLLITSDWIQTAGYTYPDQLISIENGDSGFQRILLFELMNAKVFELKMPSSG